MNGKSHSISELLFWKYIEVNSIVYSLVGDDDDFDGDTPLFSEMRWLIDRNGAALTGAAKFSTRSRITCSDDLSD